MFVFGYNFLSPRLDKWLAVLIDPIQHVSSMIDTFEPFFVFLIVASAVFRVLFCAGGRVRFVVVYLVAHNDIEKVLRCQLTSTLYGSDASI